MVLGGFAMARILAVDDTNFMLVTLSTIFKKTKHELSPL